MVVRKICSYFVVRPRLEHCRAITACRCAIEAWGWRWRWQLAAALEVTCAGTRNVILLVRHFVLDRPLHPAHPLGECPVLARRVSMAERTTLSGVGRTSMGNITTIVVYTDQGTVRSGE